METIQSQTPCVICKKYGNLFHGYPLNHAIEDYPIPHCHVHGNFKCNFCGIGVWFNGIAWCTDCKKLTCLKCGNFKISDSPPPLTFKTLKISCGNCGNELFPLEVAELQGTHPFQTGQIRPNFEVYVWFPLFEEISQNMDSPEFEKLRVVTSTGKIEKTEFIISVLLEKMREKAVQAFRLNHLEKIDSIRIMSENIIEEWKPQSDLDEITVDLLNHHMEAYTIFKRLLEVIKENGIKADRYKIYIQNPLLNSIGAQPETSQSPQDLSVFFPLFGKSPILRTVGDFVIAALDSGFRLIKIEKFNAKELSMKGIDVDFPFAFIQCLTLEGHF
ncbi:MAG: hypothetical protein D6732_27300 [Methanobacteriota archaeon]|nr:MAG: hypothetical protein D6732_27300 [Euryarchaeota archaeon]